MSVRDTGVGADSSPATPTQALVAAVYADGGCIKCNPSPIGGTWATCHVTCEGTRRFVAYGIVRTKDTGTKVTNNQTEFYALLMGLEALPNGWSGAVYSDSDVTLQRFFRNATARNIPADWHNRMFRCLDRLGTLTPVLLSGHPTKKELEVGVSRSGHPVSEHNVFCDRMCTETGQRYWATKRKS